MRSILLFIIYFYRAVIRPPMTLFFGPRCRFYPSCSEYAVRCVDKYSAFQASKKIISRLLRCMPWNPGGFDYP